MRTLAARAAITGFGIAVILAALAFYETSAPSRDHIVSDLVFVVLCPPSIGAMGLEKTGLIGGLFVRNCLRTDGIVPSSESLRL
jgi:hypothetical protein